MAGTRHGSATYAARSPNSGYSDLVVTDRQIQRFGALAGVIGPQLLVAYFSAPALTGWSFAGAAPDRLIAYANGHKMLFYAMRRTERVQR